MYYEIGINNPTFLQCYGISQDEKAKKNYIIDLKYIEAEYLYKNIVAAFLHPSKKNKKNYWNHAVHNYRRFISNLQENIDGEPFSVKLRKLCQKMRPGFNEGTPECYINLAKRCMDSDPKNGQLLP
ncbi:36881_t:CDS:2 [Gigaspora margarita]|uniref:36881_t:CDS:1 n=1 Tax=Gigaspora margarita TaxID=4874 RepID=A0ABN7WNI6_GIGMA|nr:36881_t:CDS:2 [Gigaspora margarita]